MTIRISILPFGDVGDEELYYLYEKLSYYFRAEILYPVPIPRFSFDKRRGQYAAVRFMNVARKYEGDKILGVTEVDLFTPHLNFIFGQAEIGGRVALISLYRLRSEDKELYHARVIKEAIHELGHTFGLRHCNNQFCVMFFSNTLADTDRKTGWYCEKCEKMLYSKDVFRG